MVVALVATFVDVPPAAAAGSVPVEVTVIGDGAPLDGATLTLLDGGTVVDATNESAAGRYDLTADPGGYLLSVVPPPNSMFGPTTVPVSVVAPGPTQVTVALVSDDTSPPSDPSEPEVTVSGRLTGGDGAYGRRLRVQFSSPSGTRSVDTDREFGNYSLSLRPGEYVVRISTGSLTPPLVGWPNRFDLTYTVPVTVHSGVQHQTLDLSVPFVAQPVVARTIAGDPAVGVTIEATGEDRSLTATVGGAPVIWGLRDDSSTDADGEATLWVLPGTYRMVGLRGTDFAADVLREEVALPAAVPEFTFEPLVLPEITGRMIDRAGNGIGGGGYAVVRIVGTSLGSRVGSIATDGSFRVARPESDGPFELTVVGGGQVSSGTPTYLDARSWQLHAGPFAMTGNEELGDITVPGAPVEVCPVDRISGDPVWTNVGMDAVVPGLAIGSATGSLSFTNRLFSIGTPDQPCARMVLPPGNDSSFEVSPVGLTADEGYYPTTTQIVATFDPSDPERVERFDLPIDNFANLNQDAAVDVDLRLVTTAGLPVGPVRLDLASNDPIFTRSVDAPDGAVSTRLVRQQHVVTSSGALPADRAAKRGDLRLRLALGATDVSRPGVDLGSIELPYIPVDLTVRGVDGVPLSFALIRTNSRQFCAAGSGLVEEVCARSTYNARLDERNDRVVTDEYGRARIWLVPHSYSVEISPPSGGSGYQGMNIPLVVEEGSPGVALFANLANSTIEPAPVPPLQITAGGPYTVAEGGSVDLSAIVVSGTAEEITWDLSGDGAFDAVGASVPFDATTSSGPAVMPVAVRACDADAACVVDATSVIVANVAPVVASVADRAVQGGDEVVVSTTFTDPGADDVHTATVTVGAAAPVVAVVTSPDGPARGVVEATITAPMCSTQAACELPVTIRVSDGFTSGTTQFLLTVAGTAMDDDPGTGDPVPDPLAVTAGGPYTVPEGGVVDVAAVVTSGTAETVAWDLSGDGMFDALGASVAFVATGLSGPAQVEVVVEACDASQTCVRAAAVVDVVNVAPSLAPVQDQVGVAGEEVEFSTTFTDPGADDVHTGTITVGDDEPVTAGVTPPAGGEPGVVAATVRLPDCATEADCVTTVSFEVSDGTDTATTAFTVTVAGTTEDDGPGVDHPGPGPVVPTTLEQCKRGGWRTLTDPAGDPFINQGECVSFVASEGRRSTVAGEAQLGSRTRGVRG